MVVGASVATMAPSPAASAADVPVDGSVDGSPIGPETNSNANVIGTSSPGSAAQMRQRSRDRAKAASVPPAAQQRRRAATPANKRACTSSSGGRAATPVVLEHTDVDVDDLHRQKLSKRWLRRRHSTPPRS